MTAETLNKVVEIYRGVKQHRNINVSSRLRCEDVLWFAHDLAKVNGNEELATNIVELIWEVDDIPTEELVRLHTFE